MAKPEAVDTARMRERLAAMRAELEALIAQGAEGGAIVELDQTRVGRLSRMDALQQQQMARETERRRRLDLQRIDAALARIDAGEYGWCMSCDEPIAPKRLDLDPAASLCVACAGRA